MVREAELHAEEDQKQREEIETRNMADSLVYTAERTLLEHGERVPLELKGEVEGKIAAVRSALQSGDTYQTRSAMEELEASLQRLGAAVYSHAGSASPSGDGQQPEGDGTVEGEFREV